MSFFQRFMSPVKRTVLYYIVFSFVFFLVLALSNLQIIPCTKQVVVGDGMDIVSGYCGITESPQFIEYNALSYLVIFLIVVIIPYSAAVYFTSRGYRPPKNNLPPPSIPALPEAMGEAKPGKSRKKHKPKKKAKKKRKR